MNPRDPEEDARRAKERPLDEATFRELYEEGKRLGRQFDKDSAPMRQFTAEDLARRSRLANPLEGVSSETVREALRGFRYEKTEEQKAREASFRATNPK